VTSASPASRTTPVIMAPFSDPVRSPPVAKAHWEQSGARPWAGQLFSKVRERNLDP
jgi:hypothetical protein